jgi:phage terminase small subunit
MPWRPLTSKQLQFAEEYKKDFNATQAAIRAGYSARSAGIIGFATKRHPLIAEMIEQDHQRRRAEIRLEIAARSGIRASWVPIGGGRKIAGSGYEQFGIPEL